MVLALSLQAVNSQYPLIVGVTKDIVTLEIIQILNGIGCRVQSIDSLKYSDTTQNKWKNHSVLNTASKFELFNLKQWDKLVYLDTDILVLENIDDLFNKPDGSMLWWENGDCGLSGCFVFEPKHHDELKYYLSLIENIDTFDGDLLGNLWFVCKSNEEYRITENYLCECGKHLIESFETKAIHFGGTPLKPWMDSNDFMKQDNKITRLYKYYLEIIKKKK